MQQPIIRAIDLGYGNTKYIYSDNTDNEMQCNLFPSIAPHASANGVGKGILKKRDTISVCVEDQYYEVGADCELVENIYSIRPLHENFTDTPEYMALFYGALAYMNAPHIDLLVVGLPVKLLRSKDEILKQKLKGKHSIAGKTITIQEVLVISQPLGGFVDYAKQHETYKTLKDQQNLLLDPGMFTFDWLMTKGLKEVPHQSDSFPCGVSRILKKIAQLISEEKNINFNDLSSIDKGLRQHNFRLYGKQYDVTTKLQEAITEIDPAIHALTNSVGDGRGIDNIFLVGGGSEYFAPAIKSIFPNHHVITVGDPVFANVRGFQWVGKEVYEHMTGKTA